MPACSYISGTDTLKLLSVNVDKNILGYPMTLYSNCIKLYEYKVQNHKYFNFSIFASIILQSPGSSLPVPANIFTTAQIGSLHFTQVSPLPGLSLDCQILRRILLCCFCWLFYWMLFIELIEHFNDDSLFLSTICLS